MLGAIIGDIVGSVFEFDRRKDLAQTHFNLFQSFAHYTDDTVMTVAIMEAIMKYQDDHPGRVDRNVLKEYCKTEMIKWGRKYPFAGYGSRFALWLLKKDPQPYHSFGNGSAMRVSPAAYLYENLDDVLEAAVATALPSHNHPLGIKGAKAVAYCIWAARHKQSKKHMKEYVEREFGYNLDFTLDQIRPVYSMDETCEGSVPQAIRAFLESNSYEDCIRKAVSIGGDADTIACIAGGIAEAAYDIPIAIANDGMDRLPLNMKLIINNAYKRIYKVEDMDHDDQKVEVAANV